MKPNRRLARLSSSPRPLKPRLFAPIRAPRRTPVSNAEEYRAGFSDSTHLIIEGAVHSDPLFLSSPQIKDVMLRFMKGQPVSTTRIAPPPMKFVPLKEPMMK